MNHLLLKNHMFGGFSTYEDKTINVRAEMMLAKLTKKYGVPQCGRNRATFISKNFVIKFPLNDNGIADNDYEGSCSSFNLAKGRWIQLDGFVCVIQEKLTMIKDFNYDEFPQWIGSIDDAQVGYDRKGNIKAFDFGTR